MLRGAASLTVRQKTAMTLQIPTARNSPARAIISEADRLLAVDTVVDTGSVS